MNLALQRVERFLNKNPQFRHIILWGNGQLGSAIAKLIQKRFSQIMSVNIVDSTVKESKNQGLFSVHPIAKLNELPCDCLIVASIAYEAEITNQIALQYSWLKEKVLVLSNGSIIDSNSETFKNYDNIKDVRANIFEYPDEARLWLALADDACDEDKKVFLQCASVLQE